MRETVKGIGRFTVHVVKFIFSKKYVQKLDEEEAKAREAFREKCVQYAEELEMDADEFNHQSPWYPCLRAEQSYAEVKAMKEVYRHDWILSYHRSSEPREFAKLMDTKEYRCKLLGQRCTRIEHKETGCTNCLVPLHDEKIREMVVTVEDVIQ